MSNLLQPMGQRYEQLCADQLRPVLMSLPPTSITPSIMRQAVAQEQAFFNTFQPGRHDAWSAMGWGLTRDHQAAALKWLSVISQDMTETFASGLTPDTQHDLLEGVLSYAIEENKDVFDP